MKNSLKYELQNLLSTDGYTGQTGLIGTIQRFLRTNETTSESHTNPEFSKNQEEKKLIDFIEQHRLWFQGNITPENYLTQGAEQKVYWYDNLHIIKLNNGIFYQKWLDYFNSLLIHNYLMSTTTYELLGFKIIEQKLHSVVKQRFIQTQEQTDLYKVKQFLEYNNFKNTRNNDYMSSELGIILEDLHDENVLTKNNIFYFIDTIFYLTDTFWKP